MGIAVGVAAIVALMSIGFGMEHAITSELVRMADTIMVMPGKIIPGRGYVELGGFTERDVRDIERIRGVRSVMGVAIGVAEVEHAGEKIPVEVVAGNPGEMRKMYGEEFVELEEGRWLGKQDRRGCTVGYMVANEYFGEEIRRGDKILINGERFRVVGVFEKAGVMASSDVDPHIFITLEAAREVLGTDEISFIMVNVHEIGEAEEIAEEIERVIDDNHNLDDFTEAMTMTSLIEQIGGVFSIIQAVLVGIASIALIVASIGIMNTMLMSVMERTHEIGIMKAIGATNRDIMFLFLSESGVISLAGGTIGCGLGLAAAKTISTALSKWFNIEIETITTPETIIGGLTVAIMVGILSGLHPARKASKMSPVEAVRYE